MHAKTNRQNHDFQILHFLIGACHTPDGAYALLCDLRDDRADALAQTKAARLREQAKIIRAQRLTESRDEAERLDGEADLAEIEATAETLKKNIAAAKAELSFIENCIAQVQPYRVYANLPDSQAHEACQREEWRLELQARAENFLLTSGSIPPEHFATMRQHPDFAERILPDIQRTQELLAQGHAEELLSAPRPLDQFLVGYEPCSLA